MSVKRDLVIDVEWETDGDLEALESLETRWVIPHDAYNDDDGETDDLNMVVCDHLSEESGWLVADWTFIEYRTAK
jgi:hypothetical protein